MALYTITAYFIPAILVLVAVYVGVLGVKFHIEEVIRKND